MIRCGCGGQAEYLVYETEEPHCVECMKDAVECATFILVRKPLEGIENAIANKNQVQ